MPKATQQTANANTLILIKKQDDTCPLSPVQKKFNTLIKQIEKQKKLLAEWQETFEFCHHHASSRLIPITQKFAEHQAEMVLLIHRQAQKHSFTPKQKEKIKHIIVSMAEDVLNIREDEELENIYKLYANSHDDEISDDERQLVSAKIREMFLHDLGIILPDDLDLSNRETVEKLLDELEESYAKGGYQEEIRPKRKKTAKQKAKEARQQEEEANTSKSIQAIYRELVTSLHPDREPDAEEKHRKTELMKQVTVAYKKKDLLKLLELQVKIEKIDQEKINSINEERLIHYNTILKNQLENIKMECLFIQDKLKIAAGYPSYILLKKEYVKEKIMDDIAHMEEMTSLIINDLHAFEDVKALKKWINRHRIDDLEIDFNDIFR